MAHKQCGLCGILFLITFVYCLGLWLGVEKEDECLVSF